MKIYNCKCEKINLCDCGANWMCKKCGNGFGVTPHDCFKDSFNRAIEDVKNKRTSTVENITEFLEGL